MISILLWIAEKRPDSTLVNYAAAIDSLLDGLLNKLQESKSRSGVDSNFKRHFLAEFAVYLHERNATSVSNLEFEKFLVGYLNERALTTSIVDMSSELVDKGILTRTPTQVAFKFECFRAFFFAQKLAETPDLLALTSSLKRIGSFANEFDLLTGMHRDREDVMKTALNQLRESYIISGASVSSKVLDGKDVEVQLVNEGNAEKIGRKFLQDPAARTDLTAELDDLDDIPDIASTDPDYSTRRPAIVERSGLDNHVAILKVASSILRNAELVANGTVKRELFAEVLEG